MPFDPVPQELTLADLSWRLRHPETWPAGFVWNYSDCSSCAVGLAWNLAGHSSTAEPLDWEKWLVEQFPVFADEESPEIPNTEADHIFFALHCQHDYRHSAITPAMVADAIDAWLVKEQTAPTD